MPRPDRIRWLFAAMLCVWISACSKHETHGLAAMLDEAPPPDSATSAAQPSLGEWPALTAVQADLETYVVSRTPRLTKYPCTNCHTKPLKEMKSVEVRKAHWDITLQHAAENIMTCLTCHTETNLDTLHNLTNQTLSFNTSHEVCGQCHFTQLRDWKGGAHGKRAGGWVLPRVLTLCVECHNPHRPAFDSRWPAIRSNLMERLR